MKSNNPANQAILEAAKQGLTYWEYMEKTNPGCVKHHSGARKRRLKGIFNDQLEGANDRLRGGKFGLKFLLGLRHLVGGRKSGY